MLWLEIEGNGQSLLMKEGENDKKAGFWGSLSTERSSESCALQIPGIPS